jgi:hypothetical protein
MSYLFFWQTLKIWSRAHFKEITDCYGEEQVSTPFHLADFAWEFVFLFEISLSFLAQTLCSIYLFTHCRG